jgi:magnesium-transporting ATPase (P-type)
MDPDPDPQHCYEVSYHVYTVQGSPEKIQRLCVADSLPRDYASMLDRYASHGYRILAIACKFVPVNQARMAKINKMTRAEMESDLTFLGLIVLENRLKVQCHKILWGKLVKFVSIGDRECLNTSDK